MFLDKWGLRLDITNVDDFSIEYLKDLPDEIPSVQWVWSEMDRVWDEAGLDNKKKVASQDLGKFYGHPVWIMNGLFTEIDPESAKHRAAISGYLNKRDLYSIADYGGGSGVLAKMLSDTSSDVLVHIVEPFAFEFFKQRLSSARSVQYVSNFQGCYDVAIAQDVLEHVDSPIETAFEIADHVRDGGLVIFANCFYPVIKCHLPSTFYLRYTFKFMMEMMGLKYVGTVPGTGHALVFERRGALSLGNAVSKSKVIRPLGSVINASAPVLRMAKRVAG